MTQAIVIVVFALLIHMLFYQVNRVNAVVLIKRSTQIYVLNGVLIRLLI